MTTDLETAMERHGITIRAAFVPFSQSRNAKPDPKPSDLSLNWKVTLLKDGREVLTTDYQAGIGHAPSYKQGRFSRISLDDMELLLFEAEKGKAARRLGNLPSIMPGKVIEPKASDVVYSLLSDASVLDCATFEEWASELGYDPDSRKAESIYRACLEIALKLRNGLGDAVLAELREAAQDY